MQNKRDLARIIETRGGLAATNEFYAEGWTRHEVAAAVRRRRIFRVRQGWYARPGTHPRLLAAARVGGRATCTTGLALHGIWVQATPTLQVACAAHDARLRTPHDSRIRLSPDEQVRVHWRALPTGGSRLILPPLECLRDAFLCLDAESIAQSADSLLRLRPESRRDWAAFCHAAPERLRAALRSTDGVCESGIETLVWLRLRDRGAPIRRQVEVRGVGRVDFVLGDRLVLEADGEAYHTDAGQFERDRQRDARLAALGYVTLRFSYRQVTERWGEVASAVDAALARGLHRR